jgi:MFS family permease
LRTFLPQITPHLRLGLRWPDGIRTLRHRNFRLFFFGQLISLIGTWMQSTAQQWLVFRLTGSELSLGIVTFAGFIPVLVLSLFMGVVVDRFPRRKLLLITQTWFMILAVALAVLTYLRVVQYWHVLTLAFLLGVGNALDMPARQAFYIDMVDHEELLNAIALNSSVFNGARIIGPALGGLVVAALGEAPAFALNALSFLAVLAGLAMMRLPQFEPPANAGSGMTQLRQGLSYLISERRVFGLVSMVALLSVFGFPYVVLLPVFAGDILKTGASGFGALMAAQGVGALISALSLAFLGDRHHKGRLLQLSFTLLAVAMLVLGLSKSLWLSMLALCLGGYALISQLAVTNTLVQVFVPDELRGRVLSTYTWALGGFWPIGALLIGWTGDRLGAPEAVMIAAACTAVIALLGRVWFPQLKSID